MTHSPVVDVRDLTVEFATATGSITAVRSASFALSSREIVGLVGETGSGKSTIGRAVLGYVRPPGRIVSGSVIVGGRNVLSMSQSDLRRWRGAAAGIVIQNPRSALNPVETVGSQIWRMYRAHATVGTDRSSIVNEALKEVRIPDPQRVAASYPHQLSGGMVQRVLIAMAFLHRPALLVADEATTGLDVTIQTHILDLLRDLVEAHRMSALVVSHDFGVIWHYCSRVLVMKDGEIVEQGPTAAVFQHPEHAYTRQLVQASSFPHPSATESRR